VRRSNGIQSILREDIMQGIKIVRATTFGALLAVVLLSVVFVSPVIGQDGKQIYSNRCALCHGPDGDGKGGMPAIPLSPEETKAVVEYMKSSFKK
jgi:cytochrome c5